MNDDDASHNIHHSSIRRLRLPENEGLKTTIELVHYVDFVDSLYFLDYVDFL
mgnify:CR=1 FL=1